MNEQNPWDKLQTESPEEYSVFLEYLHAGKYRDPMDVLKKKLNRSNIKTIPFYWHEVIKKNNWLNRAEAFDNQLFNEAKEEYQDLKKSNRSARIQLNNELHNLIYDLIEHYKTKDPDYLQLKEIILMVTKLHNELRTELGDSDKENEASQMQMVMKNKGDSKNQVVIYVPENNR